MFTIVKNVILNGRFELSDMLKKIDTLWVQGSITDDEKSQLITLARENADPQMSMDLTKRMDDIETRVKKLEAGQIEGTPTPSEEYPEFVHHRAYVNGDKVTFNGKKYICTLPEHTDRTTWSPADYPNYWREVK